MTRCPEAPPDGTRDGGGVWQGGRWIVDGITETSGPAIREGDNLFTTHHEAGSAEESYSRQMRFDKYLAMQQLLVAISESSADTAKPFDWVQSARQILAGMVRPTTATNRAADRLAELKLLEEAYRSALLVDAQTAELLVEALKAWERAHPPVPMDTLLLKRP